MAIDNRSGGRRFGADDRTLLEGLAVQAVIAIQNARLIDDLKSSRQQVERLRTCPVFELLDSAMQLSRRFTFFDSQRHLQNDRARIDARIDEVNGTA